jgi:hypothetical protein
MTIEFEKFFQLYFNNVEFESLKYFKKTKVEDSNYIKGNVSINLPNNVSSYPEQDYLKQVSGVIKNEIQQHVQGVIFSEIKKGTNVNFINIIDNSNSLTNYESIQNMSRRLVQQLSMMSVKNIISNGKILSEYISDSTAYNCEKIGKVLQSSTFSKHGSLLGRINVFMDSFMKYNEEFVLTFDDVYFDIKEITPYISTSVPGNAQLKVEFKYFTNILNPSIIYIVDSENSTNYHRFKSERRDEIINKLLDDDKGTESNF